MTRVLLVDDHTLVRKGVRRILEDYHDVTLIDEAPDGDQALARLADTQYDVVVLDIALPGTDGVEIAKQVRRRQPRTAVLVLSMYPEQQYAVRVLKAGAAGYLTKDRAPQELVAAIRKVAAGGKYITPSVAEWLAVQLDQVEDPPFHERLSDRELAVLRALVRGRKLRDIAADLNVSIKTVSTYRSRILRKSGMTSNAELVRHAVEHRLVE